MKFEKYYGNKAWIERVVLNEEKQLVQFWFILQIWSSIHNVGDIKMHLPFYACAAVNG